MEQEIIEIIKQSADSTIYKNMPDINEHDLKLQEYKFLWFSLIDIINKNNFSIFTRDDNARNNIMTLGREAIIVELIRGAYLTYMIDTLNGNKHSFGMCGNKGYPENEEQAVNYVYNELSHQKSPDLVYEKIQSIPNLLRLLTYNYAYLATFSTVEERMHVYSSTPDFLQDKLIELDNFQKELIANNNIQFTGNIGHMGR